MRFIGARISHKPARERERQNTAAASPTISSVSSSSFDDGRCQHLPNTGKELQAENEDDDEEEEEDDEEVHQVESNTPLLDNIEEEGS